MPNADHFTMAQQFDLAIEVLMNFMKRVIEAEKKPRLM